MITITTTNLSSGYKNVVTLEPRWMRASLCMALQMLFQDFASETLAKLEVVYSGVEDDNLDRGIISIEVDKVSQAWQDKLGEVLSQAEWDFKTRVGYGEFIETLNALRVDKALIKGE